MDWGNCLWIISNGCCTKYWHKVRLFNIPCGRTFQWYLFVGWPLLKVGTEKANLSLSHSCRGLVKKQSFRSINPYVKQESNGIPGCKEIIDWIILLIHLIFVSILHLPDYFFDLLIPEPLVLALLVIFFSKARIFLSRAQSFEKT